MMAGLAIGSSGCLCRCPERSLQTGVFEIFHSPERPELVGGIVDVSDDRVEISFTDEDGNSWVIEYSIAHTR